MRLSLKLFASLTRAMPGMRAGIPREIEVADGLTVADLVVALALPPREVKVVFVNGRAQPPEWPLADGDEVGIFPPVGGG